MHNLARSYFALGHYAEALKLHEETLAQRRSKLGPDHPHTLLSMNDLALSLHALGHHAEALKLIGETVELSKAKLGPDLPDTLSFLDLMAECYAALGSYANAFELRNGILPLRKAKLGPDHPDALGIQASLAGSLLKLGLAAEALSLARQTAGQWEKLVEMVPESLYNAAWCHALIASATRAAEQTPESTKRADSEADRAIHLLKDAVAGGWSGYGLLQINHDLDSLRGRSDFQSMLAELQAAAEKN